MLFEDIILSNKNPLNHLITPLTPYFICNHFIARELDPTSSVYVGKNIKVTANNLIKNNNYYTIQNMDIVQVQVNYLDFFHEEILPILLSENKKIILITSQLHLPQIQKSQMTDEILNHPSVLLWISQNPIYQHEKYMAFPYGMHHLDIDKYVLHYKYCEKQKKIINQHAGLHPHLPPNHIRRNYDIFGKNSGVKLPYELYLNNIAESEFVISTSGDREDCYRHYECIGLGAIPVSDINTIYKDIFGDNIIFSNAEKMVQMLETNQVPPYNPPNKDILTIAYWKNKIKERIKK